MINSYYLLIDGEKIGPYTQYEIMDMNLDVHTMILSPLADDWQEMLDLPEFTLYLHDKDIYIPTQANLASFWWRLLAYVIDYVIIIIIAMVFFTVYYASSVFLMHVNYEAEQDESLLNLLGIVAMIMYHTILEATNLRGGVGKVICKLCVVNANGGRITLLNALGRNSAKLFSYFLFGLGFLSILWNRNRQGWHDGIAKTFVIRRK